jgi:hypothetical protein
MSHVIPGSGSRKVNGYVKAVLALEAVRKKRAHRYDQMARPLDRRCDQLTAEVATRLQALTGGQLAAAQRILRDIKDTLPLHVSGPAASERRLGARKRGTADRR